MYVSTVTTNTDNVNMQNTLHTSIGIGATTLTMHAWQTSGFAVHSHVFIWFYTRTNSWTRVYPRHTRVYQRHTRVYLRHTHDTK